MAVSQSVIDLVYQYKLAIATLLFLSGLFSIAISRIYFHPLSPYPGPFLGRFTDFYSFYGVYKQKRTRLQYEFLQEYGSPVRFSTNELVFSDPNTITEIYGQSSAMPEKERTIHEALSATGEASVLTIIDKARHGRVRRLLSHAFSLQGLLEAENVIIEKIDLFIDINLRPALSDQERLTDIYEPTHKLFLDIVSQLSFEQSFDTLTDKSSTALEDVNAFGKVIPPQAFFPGFRYLPVRSIREGFEGVARLVTFARECVAKHVQGDKHTSHRKSILKNMFNAYDTESSARLTREEMVENTIIFLFGGTSTTAVTVLYVVWECGRRPGIMAKLVRDIRAAFPDPSQMPTYVEASKLTYLSNVVDETLRLWGPLNTGVPRISTGRMIGGEYFKPGVGVSNNSYATARDPNIFPEPYSFDPDRWDNATREMRLMSRPFSIGPRNCIGRHLALIGIYLTITRMLQLFDITTDPSMTEVRMKQRDEGVLTPWDQAMLIRVSNAGCTKQD